RKPGPTEPHASWRNDGSRLSAGRRFFDQNQESTLVVATVTLDGVRKSFAEREVVHGVSCDVADGELVVVVGPSGCGKSTLLRMVAGLERVSAGSVAIDGRIVNGVEPKDRDIAMVFQNYALYPHMSVYDNMAYG